MHKIQGERLLPVVSAIIPTRGRPALLLRAVASALAQSFTALEVIVVIDGPDQETLSALEGIDDPRLRVLPLKENVGGSEARNVGARVARGEWIALLDDDDEWLPNKIDAQVTAAAACRATQPLVTSRYFCRTNDTTVVVRPRRLPRRGEAIAEYMFDYLCYFQTSTFFCSKKLFLEIPFERHLKSFQDIDWFLRVNRNPAVELLIVPEPLSIYYVPSERATITNKLGWKQRLEWGKQNRNLMSNRAYSHFVAGSCVARAVQDKAGLGAFLELTRECLFSGSPSFSCFALLLGTYVVPSAIRRKVRDSIFLARKRY